MSIRTRTPSIFRPRKAIDQHVLTENRALVEDINRRNVLRGAVSLGALTLLTGCDVSEVSYVAALKVAEHVTIARPAKKVDKLAEPPL